MLGTGLSRIARPAPAGVNLRTFMYPGVLAMAVLFTAMFSAASIVWDREFGFLREMLVAPVSRALDRARQVPGRRDGRDARRASGHPGAGRRWSDVPYSPSLILTSSCCRLLLAFTLTAFGVMIAARIKQIQSFMAVTQMLIMPLFFLSGALFPLSGLPTWLTVLNRARPADLRRRPDAARGVRPPARRPGGAGAAGPGVTWGGWQVPPVMCALVVVALGVLLTAVAIAEFRKIE